MTKNETQQGDSISYIATGDMRASPFNRERAKRYSASALEKLAANLKEHRQIEPVIVRTLTSGRFELVAGERRWRACMLADIAFLACIVRELSDREVCDVMLSENLQRENLSPVEEACVFADMLKALDGDGAKIYATMDDLFTVTGKKRDVIENRLRLLNCPAFLLDAIDSGAVPCRSGELVGRVPNPERREEAARRALSKKYGEGPMTVREVAAMLKTDFMCTLKGCGFDLNDAELLPVEIVDGVRVSGGDCESCPFRSGNDPSLQAVLSTAHDGRGSSAGVDGNICQNPNCLERKQITAWKAVEKSAEANGLRVMSKERGKELLAGWNVDLDVYHVGTEKYIAQDERPGHEHTGHFANDDLPVWETLLEGGHVSWIVVKDGRRPRYFLESDIAVETATLLLRRRGEPSLFKVKTPKLAKAVKAPVAEEEEEPAPEPAVPVEELDWVERKQRARADEARLQEMLRTIHERLPLLLSDTAGWRRVGALFAESFLQMFAGENVLAAMCAYYGTDESLEDLLEHEASLSMVDAQAFVMMALVRTVAEHRGVESTTLAEWVEMAGGANAELPTPNIKLPTSNEGAPCAFACHGAGCQRIVDVPRAYVANVVEMELGEFLCDHCGGTWVSRPDEEEAPKVKKSRKKAVK